VDERRFDFRKERRSKEKLQEQWDKTEKKYLTIVHGILKEKQGVISSYLAENKMFVVYSTKDSSKGKLSHTAYKVIKESGDLSLLEINLLTGRKNQIRVHMADEGHPIVAIENTAKAMTDIKGSHYTRNLFRFCIQRQISE
jgi:tRNA pseudouridine32 synthase/23S rRNA pseudouridine746 synthase/23S rRNA pseudouridine1911/1915/1917 synthase